jgi:hypothetical protein
MSQFQGITPRQAAYLAVLIHRTERSTYLRVKAKLGLTGNLTVLSKQQASDLISELKEVTG